jgi:hypothetical protein
MIGLIPAKKYTMAITGHPITMVVRAICLILASAVMSLSVSSVATSSILCDGNESQTCRAAQLPKGLQAFPAGERRSYSRILSCLNQLIIIAQGDYGRASGCQTAREMYRIS